MVKRMGAVHASGQILLNRGTRSHDETGDIVAGAHLPLAVLVPLPHLHARPPGVRR
jgi:hypothetical protein